MFIMDTEEIKENYSVFEGQVADLDAYLRPLFEVPMEELSNRMTEVEKAKLNIVMAYAINALFYVYLRTQGCNPNDHPVKQELERIKLYIQKIKELTEKDKATKATLQLNVDAANRFIKHALAGNHEPSNSVESENNSKQKEEADGSEDIIEHSKAEKNAAKSKKLPSETSSTSNKRKGKSRNQS